MKLGVVIPTFAWTPDEALTVAAGAAAFGVDGVFAYDHLWPMGNRSRPAMAPFPILSEIATRHESLFVGTLVARIGMVPDEVLLSQFRALGAVAPGRVVAAIGTGDKLSAEENEAYGIGFAPADERRASLRAVMGTLLDEGFEGWIGGGAAKTVAIAADLGCTVNMWGASPEALREQAQSTLVSWAGMAVDPKGAPPREALGRQKAELEDAGATWAVFGWPLSMSDLVGRAKQG